MNFDRTKPYRIIENKKNGKLINYHIQQPLLPELLNCIVEIYEPITKYILQNGVKTEAILHFNSYEDVTKYIAEKMSRGYSSKVCFDSRWHHKK